MEGTVPLTDTSSPGDPPDGGSVVVDEVPRVENSAPLSTADLQEFITKLVADLQFFFPFKDRA